MERVGKLLLGFRKASTSTSVQLLKGSTYPHVNEFSRNLSLPNRDIGWLTNEQFGSKLMVGSFPSTMLVPETKRSRSTGSKSKRLLIESQESLELKHTLEESQDMLFPAPLLKPSIVNIDDNEFEEYEHSAISHLLIIFCRNYLFLGKGEYSQFAHLESKNNGLSVIIAPIGENYLLISFSLLNGHAKIIYGTKTELPVLHLMNSALENSRTFLDSTKIFKRGGTF